MTQICTWREYENAQGRKSWNLMVRRGSEDIPIARVSDTGCWSVGDVMAGAFYSGQEKDVRTAKAMAAAAAIEQGFI